jgi:hypothetical protein
MRVGNAHAATPHLVSRRYGLAPRLVTQKIRLTAFPVEIVFGWRPGLTLHRRIKMAK